MRHKRLLQDKFQLTLAAGQIHWDRFILNKKINLRRIPRRIRKIVRQMAKDKITQAENRMIKKQIKQTPKGEMKDWY